MLQPLHDESPHLARVSAAQQLLFPANPRGVCDEMGLNWWAVLKLHEDGWLSFPPETTLRLDEAQEAELRFVGALVMAGCDSNMLEVLLRGLAKPYAYDLKRLFYDWSARRWRLLPDLSYNAEAAFADWLEVLVQQGDVNSLAGIGELAQDAVVRLRLQSTPRESPLQLRQTLQAPEPQTHSTAEESPPRLRTVTSDGEAVQG